MTDIVERLKAYIDDSCALNAEKIEQLGVEALAAAGFAGKRGDLDTVEEILLMLCGLETNGGSVPLQRIQCRAAGFRDAFLQFYGSCNSSSPAVGYTAPVSFSGETSQIEKGSSYQPDSKAEGGVSASGTSNEEWRPRSLSADEFF